MQILRHPSTWLALGWLAGGVGLLTLPTTWMEALLPGGLPFGNLLVAAGMVCAGLTGMAYSESGSVLRLLSIVTTMVSLAWIPVGLATSGNLNFNFYGDDMSYMLWFRYTAVAAVLGIATLMATLAAAISDYVKRRHAAA
ncbi:MAG: hypothetical protein AAGM16_12500 [Pseudomonadota bacterium]|mgnify:FL=1